VKAKRISLPATNWTNCETAFRIPAGSTASYAQIALPDRQAALR
jgi:hypothetical protein